MLSTLHTNSAAETITRLLDMGMDPFNFGDSCSPCWPSAWCAAAANQCQTRGPLEGPELDELLADYLHVFPNDARPTEDAVLAEWRDAYAQDGKFVRYQHRLRRLRRHWPPRPRRPARAAASPRHPSADPNRRAG